MPNKRASWIDSLSCTVNENYAVTADAKQELSRIDEILYTAWNLGENILLAWTEEGNKLLFLSIRHYRLIEPLSGNEETGESNEASILINSLLAGSKFIPAHEFAILRKKFGNGVQIITADISPNLRVPAEFISILVTRYGVSLVHERAVMLLDIVGFSLHSPLEQVAILNSLSYSVNSAYRQLISVDVQINFARSSTGDGFYIWNRARTIDANIALYKLMMLILADNAVARKKAKKFPVPRLRAAFHVGEHYEFYQVEALNPTTFSYIVGQVTIELSRIIENALPGQILLGDFNIAMQDKKLGQSVTYSTFNFIEKTAEMLGQLSGLAVSNDHISKIRCYLTGQSDDQGTFKVGRYLVRDKHGISRPVYNAKINIHLSQGQPIFLGHQQKDLHPSGATSPVWLESET
jgi:hypothetical protein